MARLPLLDDIPTPAPQEHMVVGDSTVANRRRVIVVDNNIDAAESLAVMLEGHGHAVRVVHDAREVVSVAERFCPDVAILDIGLPHIDGYQLARNLRGRAVTAKAVLIALTGYGRPDDVERAPHRGVRSPRSGQAGLARNGELAC